MEEVNVMSQCIAVPTSHTADAKSIGDVHVSPHFGHCDQFTILTVSNGKITDSRHVATPEHGEGGCMVPVRMILNENADAVVVAGIGGRPLQGFDHFGIPVFHANGLSTVQDIVSAYCQKSLPVLDPSQACGGDHKH